MSELHFIGLFGWVPSLIAFSICLWLYLTMIGKAAVRMASVISILCFAFASLLLLSSNVGTAEGYYDALYSTGNNWIIATISLISIGCTGVLRAGMNFMEANWVGWKQTDLYFATVLFLLILTLVLTGLAFWSLIGVIPMIMVSAIIWGYVFEKSPSIGRNLHDRILMSGFAFAITFILLPFLFLALPYVMNSGFSGPVIN